MATGTCMGDAFFSASPLAKGELVVPKAEETEWAQEKKDHSGDEGMNESPVKLMKYYLDGDLLD